MTGVIRCWCSSCDGVRFLRLSDFLAAHPEVTDARWGDVDLDVDAATVARHPSSGKP